MTHTFPLLLAAETNTSLWSMIKQGGWAMYPLVLTSLALIYLFIHCYRETRDKEFGHNAAEIPNDDATVLGRILATATPKFDPARADATTEAFENEIFESLELEENAISQWIHYLSVIANVAPMIGLLGTVSGMIGGFQTMATGGMGRPELFAGDIGEALITTATGLCIGIPAMIAHSYFSNRLNTLVVETNRRASQIADSLI